MNYKILILFVYTLGIWAYAAAADWTMELIVSNSDGAGILATGNAYLGEMAIALEGYDEEDFAYLFPPMSDHYVVPYFKHNDWGANSGNFRRDFRSTEPADKTWNLEIKTQAPYSNNFTLSWSVSGSIPAYYTITLLHGALQTDMGAQSSYTYSSAASLTNMTIQISYDATMPYSLGEIGDLVFSDNQARRMDLGDYFSVASGALEYSFPAHDSLCQSIITEGDTVYWELYPTPGWSGETTVTINATANGHTLSETLNVIRDNTNSPPLMITPLAPINATQNQSISWCWAGLIYDADRDSVVVTLGASEYATATYDNAEQSMTITPAPGFKGSTELELNLSDGHNALQNYPFSLVVGPAVPAIPQNICLQVVSGSGISISWDPVITDQSGAPLSDLQYKVTVYGDLPGEDEVWGEYGGLTSPALSLPTPPDKAFIVIIAINE